MEFLSKAHFVEEIGTDNFFAEKKDAISAIYARLDQDKCAHCSARIFYECNLGQSSSDDAQASTTGMPA